MAHPLYNPYTSGTQRSAQGQYGLTSAKAGIETQGTSRYLGPGSSLGSSRAYSGAFSNSGERHCSMLSQSMAYRSEQSTSMLHTEMEHTIHGDISRAIEEVGHLTQSKQQKELQTTHQDSHLTSRDEMYVFATGIKPYPVSSSSASKKYLDGRSDEQITSGSSDWLESHQTPSSVATSNFYSSSSSSSMQNMPRSYSSQPSSFVSGSNDSSSASSAREHGMSSIPGLGDYSKSRQPYSSTTTNSSQPKYTSKSATDILQRFGLSKEDMEFFCAYPEDQITPANLPFLLRDIRIQKTKRAAAAHKTVLGLSGTTASVQPPMIFPRPPMVPPPFFPGQMPPFTLQPTLLPPEKMMITNKFPTQTMINDYTAATPRIFPHNCSLCNKECAHMKDWVTHQNTSLHIVSCRLLRKKYPGWDGTEAHLPSAVSSSAGRDTQSSTSSSQNFKQRYQDSSHRSHSRSRSRSRSCSRSRSRSRSPSPRRYRGSFSSSSRTSRDSRRTRSRSPRSSRHRRSRRRSRSRSHERRSSSERSSSYKHKETSAERLAKKRLETSAVHSKSDKSELEAMVQSLAPTLLAKIAKLKSSSLSPSTIGGRCSSTPHIGGNHASTASSKEGREGKSSSSISSREEKSTAAQSTEEEKSSFSVYSKEGKRPAPLASSSSTPCLSAEENFTEEQKMLSKNLLPVPIGNKNVTLPRIKGGSGSTIAKAKVLLSKAKTFANKNKNKTQAKNLVKMPVKMPAKSPTKTSIKGTLKKTKAKGGTTKMKFLVRVPQIQLDYSAPIAKKSKNPIPDESETQVQDSLVPVMTGSQSGGEAVYETIADTPTTQEPQVKHDNNVNMDTILSEAFAVLDSAEKQMLLKEMDHKKAELRRMDLDKIEVRAPDVKELEIDETKNIESALKGEESNSESMEITPATLAMKSSDNPLLTSIDESKSTAPECPIPPPKAVESTPTGLDISHQSSQTSAKSLLSTSQEVSTVAGSETTVSSEVVTNKKASKKVCQDLTEFAKSASAETKQTAVQPGTTQQPDTTTAASHTFKRYFSKKGTKLLMITQLPKWPKQTYTEEDLINLLNKHGYTHKDYLYILPQKRIPLVEAQLKERMVLVDNVDNAEDLVTQMAEFVGISSYLPLMNKVFIKFKTVEDVDQLGYLVCCSSYFSRCHFKRLTIPYSSPSASGSQGAPGNEDAVTNTNVIEPVLQGAIPPFWMPMKNSPFCFPTATPQFSIPGAKPMPFCPFAITSQFCWLKCEEFVTAHVKKPFSVKGCELTLHIVVEAGMWVNTDEEHLYSDMLKWHKMDVIKPWTLSEKLLIVSLKWSSVDIVATLMEFVSNVTPLFYCLPLANRVCFELPSRDAVQQTVMAYQCQPNVRGQCLTTKQCTFFKLKQRPGFMDAVIDFEAVRNYRRRLQRLKSKGPFLPESHPLMVEMTAQPSAFMKQIQPDPTLRLVKEGSKDSTPASGSAIGLKSPSVNVSKGNAVVATSSTEPAQPEQRAEEQIPVSKEMFKVLAETVRQLRLAKQSQTHSQSPGARDQQGKHSAIKKGGDSSEQSKCNHAPSVENKYPGQTSSARVGSSRSSPGSHSSRKDTSPAPAKRSRMEENKKRESSKQKSTDRSSSSSSSSKQSVKESAKASNTSTSKSSSVSHPLSPSFSQLEKSKSFSVTTQSTAIPSSSSTLSTSKSSNSSSLSTEIPSSPTHKKLLKKTTIDTCESPTNVSSILQSTVIFCETSSSIITTEMSNICQPVAGDTGKVNQPAEDVYEMTDKNYDKPAVEDPVCGDETCKDYVKMLDFVSMHSPKDKEGRRTRKIKRENESIIASAVSSEDANKATKDNKENQDDQILKDVQTLKVKDGKHLAASQDGAIAEQETFQILDSVDGETSTKDDGENLCPVHTQVTEEPTGQLFEKDDRQMAEDKEDKVMYQIIDDVEDQPTSDQSSQDEKESRTKKGKRTVTSVNKQTKRSSSIAVTFKNEEEKPFKTEKRPAGKNNSARGAAGKGENLEELMEDADYQIVDPVEEEEYVDNEPPATGMSTRRQTDRTTKKDTKNEKTKPSNKEGTPSRKSHTPVRDPEEENGGKSLKRGKTTKVHNTPKKSLTTSEVTENLGEQGDAYQILDSVGDEPNSGDIATLEPSEGREEDSASMVEDKSTKLDKQTTIETLSGVSGKEVGEEEEEVTYEILDSVADEPLKAGPMFTRGSEGRKDRKRRLKMPTKSDMLPEASEKEVSKEEEEPMYQILDAVEEEMVHTDPTSIEGPSRGRRKGTQKREAKTEVKLTRKTRSNAALLENNTEVKTNKEEKTMDTGDAEVTIASAPVNLDAVTDEGKDYLDDTVEEEELRKRQAAIQDKQQSKERERETSRGGEGRWNRGKARNMEEKEVLVTLDDVGADEPGDGDDEEGVERSRRQDAGISEGELQALVTLDEIVGEEEKVEPSPPEAYLPNQENESGGTINPETLLTSDKTVGEEEEEIEEEQTTSKAAKRRLRKDEKEEKINFVMVDKVREEEEVVTARTRGRPKKRARMAPVRKSTRVKQGSGKGVQEDENIPSETASSTKDFAPPTTQNTSSSLDDGVPTDISKQWWESAGLQVKRSHSQSPTVPADVKLPPFKPNNPVGLEFVVPKTGFFCHLCSTFYDDESTAKDLHCSSQEHYQNMEKYYQRLQQQL
ncbi:uncharacterized protein LOC130130447 [Lampris incognitus]|uniref:uncharacterized protein LOC130130447 n=1 Tax=Lampris incognitus TaxID=2546036 RepID=UPI0024B4EE47|nr:uncharacterized protein LOC130130447 [Lampris incognitus]